MFSPFSSTTQYISKGYTFIQKLNKLGKSKLQTSFPSHSQLLLYLCWLNCSISLRFLAHEQQQPILSAYLVKHIREHKRAMIHIPSCVHICMLGKQIGGKKFRREKYAFGWYFFCGAFLLLCFCFHLLCQAQFCFESRVTLSQRFSLFDSCFLSS